LKDEEAKMDYGSVLKKSWEITWKNKGLWLLGILSGCSSGAGNPSQGLRWTTSGQDNPQLQRTLERVPTETWTVIFACLAVFFLVFLIVVVVLSILGQAGLIAGVSKADETGSVTLREAWKTGLPHFWRLLGLSLFLLALVLVIALGVGFLAVISFGLIALCILPLLCLLIPLGILITGYLSLVQNGIVLEKQGVFEALGKGWALLRANLGPVVLMAVILWVIGLVAGLLMSLPLLVTTIPLLAVALSRPEPGLLDFAPLLGCFVLYLPVLLVLGGILKTYVSGAWTLTYRRLTGAGLAAVVVPPAA
jgi:hypothetical protein